MRKKFDSAKLLPSFEAQFSVNFIENLVLRPEAQEIRDLVGEGENLCILVGSSGAGRDTVLDECLKLSKNFKRIKRTTTREKRSARVDWERMVFIKESSFLKNLKSGEILFAGRYRANLRLYGVSKKELLKLKNQKNLYFIEANLVALPLKKLFPKSKLVIILPPSFGVLKERLFSRGKLIKELKERLKVSVSEIRTALANIEGMFDRRFVDLAVINEKPSDVVAQRVAKAIKSKKRFIENHNKLSKSLKHE